MRPSSAGLGFRDTNPGPSRGASRTKAYALVLSGCLCFSLANCGGDAGEPATPQQVAFVSDREGNFDIFLFDASTAEVTNLTAHDAMDYGFTWSPDGERIAFMSDRDGNREIYSMGVPGGDLQRLTHNDVRDGSPAWSPDGSTIAFVSSRDSDSGELYLMSSDGSNVRRVTINERYEEVPAFSPDGRYLAFGALGPPEGGGDPTLQIFRLDLETGEEVQLTHLAGHNSAPRWSPDGSRIAFYGEVGEGFEGANLLVMAADGSGLENVTDDAEPDWQPDWSADASRIVFARGPSDPLDLYVVDVDGGNMRPLVVADGRDEQPKWRPRPR